MANTKSAIKRIRRIASQTLVNKARKSKYKNAIKKMNILTLPFVIHLFIQVNSKQPKAPCVS